MAQAAPNVSNRAQAMTARRRHLGRMRNVTALLRKRFTEWRLTMKDRMTSSRRRPARWATLPTIALAALCAGLPAAQARDQQATGAQLDNALNWRAASGTGFS